MTTGYILMSRNNYHSWKWRCYRLTFTHGTELVTKKLCMQECARGQKCSMRRGWLANFNIQLTQLCYHSHYSCRCLKWLLLPKCPWLTVVWKVYVKWYPSWCSHLRVSYEEGCTPINEIMNFMCYLDVSDVFLKE